MNILVATHYFASHCSGIPFVAKDLIHEFVKEGHCITWCGFSEDNLTNEENFATFAIPGTNIIERLLRLPYPIPFPTSAAKLHKLVDWADIIHLHDSLYISNIILMNLARKLNKPVVVTQHIGHIPYSNPGLRYLMSFANHSLARYVLERSSQVVFISHQVQEYFSTFIKFKTPPIHITNGVDCNLFTPLSEFENRDSICALLCIPSGSPIALFVGRFTEKKGLRVLKEVCIDLPQLQFIFLGWGEENPSSWNLTNVHVFERVDRKSLRNFYVISDFLILPSQGEGFPLVVQEAMACGKVAIVSEELRNAVSGIDKLLFFTEPDPMHLKAKVNEILSNKTKVTNIGKQCSEFTLQNWSWSVCAKKYLDIFSELCSQNQSV